MRGSKSSADPAVSSVISFNSTFTLREVVSTLRYVEA